jgi:hypothetical protein
MLRNSKDQAFFCASMMQFLTLDKDFIEWFYANVDLQHALEPSVVYPLFQGSAYRPELLGAAADEICFDFALAEEEIPTRFAELVRAQADELNGDLKKVLHSLTPIQSAVIRVMSAKGENYMSFEAPTLGLYGKAMRQAGIGTGEI